jgi:hypothetical protein
MTAPKPGQRLRCDECGTEVVVVRSQGAVPSCCGRELGGPAPRHDTPTSSSVSDT